MQKENEFDYSVEKRFGETVASKKWGVIPYALYLYQGILDLSIRHVWFLTWLIMHKWTEDNPYPSLGKMSRITGVSDTHIRNTSRDLRRKGFLISEERIRKEDGGKNTNEYDLSPLYEIFNNLIILEEGSEDWKVFDKKAREYIASIVEQDPKKKEEKEEKMEIPENTAKFYVPERFDE